MLKQLNAIKLFVIKTPFTFSCFSLPFLSFIIMGSSGNARNVYLVFTCRLIDSNCALIRRRSRWPENMTNWKANNKNPDIIVTNCIHCFIFVAQQIGAWGESIVRSSKDLERLHLTDCGGCRAGQIWAQLTWEVGPVRRTWPEPAALPHTALHSNSHLVARPAKTVPWPQLEKASGHPRFPQAS